MIFSIFISQNSRFSNSCISAKYCPILTNHTSAKSLFVQLSDDVSISKMNPYDVDQGHTKPSILHICILLLSVSCLVTVILSHCGASVTKTISLYVQTYLAIKLILILTYTLKNKGASRCHRRTFLSKWFHKELLTSEEPFCFTKGSLW